ncbi:Glycerate kinase [Gulosibacter sp. 10]|nr:Glycerate kinase [Gulosibacter sp. 10]
MRPEDSTVLLPMADGGEGTIDALETSDPGAARMMLRVRGPLGVPVDAALLKLSDGTWIVELAETSGITRLEAVSRFSACTASTFGLGEAIRFATSRGAQNVLVALGSSASTDAGAGMLQALGAKLLDASGRDIGPGNVGLHDLASVDLSGIAMLPPRGIVALTDVTNPLLGKRGAAAVFGPQKGAASEDIVEFESGLARFAELVGLEPDAPGAGAAGGTAYGLLAIGATISPGAATIAEAIRLHETIASADLAITGEGSFDTQSLAGKVPSEVIEAAIAASTPTVVLAGRVADEVANDRVRGVAATWSLSELAGSAESAMRETELWAETAGARAAASAF